MSKYIKDFLFRGFMFSGLGPIVLGIVYWILSLTIVDFSLTGEQVLIAIISTYLLAFIQAGATVFEQIDSWSPMKSLLFHISSLYITYVLVYLVNSWIPFKIEVILLFTLIFITLFLLIWFIVYFVVRRLTIKMNSKLKS